MLAASKQNKQYCCSNHSSSSDSRSNMSLKDYSTIETAGAKRFAKWQYRSPERTIQNDIVLSNNSQYLTTIDKFPKRKQFFPYQPRQPPLFQFSPAKQCGCIDTAELKHQITSMESQMISFFILTNIHLTILLRESLHLQSYHTLHSPTLLQKRKEPKQPKWSILFLLGGQSRNS